MMTALHLSGYHQSMNGVHFPGRHGIYLEVHQHPTFQRQTIFTSYICHTYRGPLLEFFFCTKYIPHNLISVQPRLARHSRTNPSVVANQYCRNIMDDFPMHLRGSTHHTHTICQQYRTAAVNILSVLVNLHMYHTIHAQTTCTGVFDFRFPA